MSQQHIESSTDRHLLAHSMKKSDYKRTRLLLFNEQIIKFIFCFDIFLSSYIFYIIAVVKVLIVTLVNSNNAR